MKQLQATLHPKIDIGSVMSRAHAYARAQLPEWKLQEGQSWGSLQHPCRNGALRSCFAFCQGRKPLKTRLAWQHWCPRFAAQALGPTPGLQDVQAEP